MKLLSGWIRYESVGTLDTKMEIESILFTLGSSQTNRQIEGTNCNVLTY